MSGARPRRRPRGHLFVVPAGAAGVALIGYPVAYSLWVSVHDLDLVAGTWRYVGLGNYAEALGDPAFWRSVRNTLQIAAPALALELALGLALALALDRVPFRARALWVSCLVAPMMLPGAAAALVFALLYVEPNGPLNALLSVAARRPVEIPWLSSVAVAPWSVVVVEVWQRTAFVMLFLLAALSVIPEEVYEAARVDGASAAQTVRHVTLPLLRTTIAAVLVIRLIDLAKLFDLPYVLTGGGPGVATESVSMHVIQIGFQFFRIGAGAAQSFLLFAGVGVLVLLLLRLVGAPAAAR